MSLVVEQASPGFFTWWQSKVSKVAREGKLQCTNTIQASACIVFANVSLVYNRLLPVCLIEQPVIAASE